MAIPMRGEKPHAYCTAPDRSLGHALFRLGIAAALFALPAQAMQNRDADSPPESLSIQAASLATQGQYAEAETLYAHILELRENSLGAEDLSTLMAALDLARFYRCHGRPTEAEPLYERSVRELARVLDANDETRLRAEREFDQLTVELWGRPSGEILIVRSTGSATGEYPRGKRLSMIETVTLARGDSVTILDRNGTRRFNGPGRFNLGVETLLTQCREHQRAKRLTRGREGTALQCYKLVLKIEPGNEAALEGLQQTADQYAAWAVSALGGNNLSSALTYIERLATVDPEHGELDNLRQQLDKLSKAVAATPKPRRRVAAKPKPRRKVAAKPKPQPQRKTAPTSRGIRGHTLALLSPPQADIPVYPVWPPESPTWQFSLDPYIRSRSGLSLADAGNRLQSAFEGAGYLERSYYAVPGGFAIVTRIEQMDDSGNRLSGSERFELPGTRARDSLTNILYSLFVNAPPGYYRYIVVVVSDRPFSTTNRSLNDDEALRRLRGGTNRLSSFYRGMPFTSDYSVEALIYEFRWDGGDNPVRMLQPGRVQPADHLVRTGIASAIRRSFPRYLETF